MTSARAQTPHFRSHAFPELYKDAVVQELYQCSDGYIWLGTDMGLFRYDGMDFQPYITPDSISDNRVSALYEDRRGRLWIGYENGAVCYIEQFRKIQLWTPEEGLPASPVTGFGEGPDDRFWFATYGEGLYYYHQNRMYNINTDDGLGGDDVYQLYVDSLGAAWVALDDGINICTIGPAGDKQIRKITRSDGLPDYIVRTFLPDQRGNLWIGAYDQGICYLDQTTGKITIPFADWPHGTVNALALFQERELWIGTEHQGLIRYDLRDGRLSKLSMPDGETPHKILDLLKDVEGNLWMSSQNLGLQSGNRRFEFLPPRLENVQAVHVDHRNQLWVGAQEGLYRYDPEMESYRPLTAPKPLNVLSIYEDQFDNLWIGTFGDGVFCYHPLTGQWRVLNEDDGLTNGSILSIDGDGDRIWLATLGGVTEFSARENIMTITQPDFRNYNQAGGLGANFIYKVFVDRQGRAWFGTDGEGISVLDRGKITNFSMADSIPLRAVYSITEDRQGHIWLSTARGGIFEFDGQTFYPLTVKEGIRDLAITSLISDEEGNILIVHPSGIDILDPASRHLIYYDREVGIDNIDPNLNAVCRDNRGQVWIGARRRVIRYTTLKERLNIHPRTHIDGLSVLLKPVDYRQKTIFAHWQNNLIFQFTGLWYTDPTTVKFRYQLEGFDFDWIVSRDRQAVYPSLPPGDYVFRISSTENEAFDQEPTVSYAFRIRLPLWRRPWFIVLALLAAGLLAWQWIRRRDARLQREALLLRENIESQFEALKSQINPHFLFNSFNTLVTIIEENPELAVEYVEKLSDLFRNILHYREKDLISIQEELKLIEDYRFLLQKRFGENLQIQIDNGWGDVYIAPLTLQILVENAIKHNVISAARPLTVRIQYTGDYLKVQNNLQQKFTKEPSTGFGLQSITKRYQLLCDKKVKVEETEDTFTVYIPLVTRTEPRRERTDAPSSKPSNPAKPVP